MYDESDRDLFDRIRKLKEETERDEWGEWDKSAGNVTEDDKEDKYFGSDEESGGESQGNEKEGAGGDDEQNARDGRERGHYREHERKLGGYTGGHSDGGGEMRKGIYEGTISEGGITGAQDEEGRGGEGPGEGQEGREDEERDCIAF
ncbi:uncharacterized protein [Euwallacea similis]|uniref:uncharacterized protein n=1 Tax=Euwallacea similis TaxID=1736056 RepID=UPI0034509B0D